MVFQTLRLLVRPRPWRIKLHFGRSLIQLAAPTDPSEIIFIFIRNLRKSSSFRSNHYVSGIIGKFVSCCYLGYFLSYSSFKYGNIYWCQGMTHGFENGPIISPVDGPAGPSSSLTIWSSAHVYIMGVLYTSILPPAGCQLTCTAQYM